METPILKSNLGDQKVIPTVCKKENLSWLFGADKNFVPLDHCSASFGKPRDTEQLSLMTEFSIRTSQPLERFYILAYSTEFLCDWSVPGNVFLYQRVSCRTLTSFSDAFWCFYISFKCHFLPNVVTPTSPVRAEPSIFRLKITIF